MKNFLICCTSIISLLSFEAQALTLILASDKIEDHNQTLGIQAAFEKLSPEKVSVQDLNGTTLTSMEIKDKIERVLSEGEKVVFIGAGDAGIDAVKDLPKDPNLVTCLTSSTPLDQNTDKGLEKVDFIALPAPVASDVKEKLGEKLIETAGVAHNRRPDMTTYDEWQKELPPADVYLGVYLRGGTPNTSEMKLFTEEEAARLADYVVLKAKEINGRGMKTCVLVLNSAQTGKRDSSEKEFLTVHREDKSDHISDLFAQKLADNDIEHKIFDFHHNTSENKELASVYDVFDLVAGAVRTTKGKMFVPGGPTFVVSEAIDIMPSESIDTMPPGKVLIYHTAGMSEFERAHVESERATGRASILGNDQDIRPASDATEVKPSANKVIAEKLLKVASAQAPWIAPESLYRQRQQKEHVEKIRQGLVMQREMKAEKNPYLVYGVIDAHNIP